MSACWLWGNNGWAESSDAAGEAEECRRLRGTATCQWHSPAPVACHADCYRCWADFIMQHVTDHACDCDVCEPISGPDTRPDVRALVPDDCLSGRCYGHHDEEGLI